MKINGANHYIFLYSPEEHPLIKHFLVQLVENIIYIVVEGRYRYIFHSYVTTTLLYNIHNVFSGVLYNMLLAIQCCLVCHRR